MRLTFVFLALLTVGAIWTAVSALQPPRITLPYATIPTGKRVVFDEFAFRYLLDGNPPLDSRSWLFLHPEYLGTPVENKNPDDVWIVEIQKTKNSESRPSRAEIVILP